MDFWCETRQAWTMPDVAAAEESRAVCGCCGDNYGCGECGYEIDLAGVCLRNTSGPAELVGHCPARSVVEK